MFALVDASHPRRAELVQAGLPDIAAQLPPRDPTAPPASLIVFPEDVGLAAGLIGSRGATARAGDGRHRRLDRSPSSRSPSPTNRRSSYYTAALSRPARPRAISSSAPPTRTTAPSTRPSATSPSTYGVYVAASVNVAPARRVEAADEPELVAQLRDPDEPGSADTPTRRSRAGR